MRDADFIFARLATSAFRSRFRLGEREAAYLGDRGLAKVLEHAADFVSRRLAPAEPINEGRQTPMRGHPVFIAQHATATCCRACLSKWHGIAAGRPLTTAEQTHIVSIVGQWLKAHTPAPHRQPCPAPIDDSTSGAQPSADAREA